MRDDGQGSPPSRMGFFWFWIFFFFFNFFLPQRFLIFKKCHWWDLKTDHVGPEGEILHLHGTGHCWWWFLSSHLPTCPM